MPTYVKVLQRTVVVVHFSHFVCRRPYLSAEVATNRVNIIVGQPKNPVHHFGRPMRFSTDSKFDISQIYLSTTSTQSKLSSYVAQFLAPAQRKSYQDGERKDGKDR